MAYARERDFLFCDLCGTMLVYKHKAYVECPLCDFRRDAKDTKTLDFCCFPDRDGYFTLEYCNAEVNKREITYSVTGEEVRRELGISTFDAGVVELPKIKKKCEKCNLEAECEYYSRQMRSADEGQTTFYKCTSCLGQFTEN